MPRYEYRGRSPQVHPTAFIAPTAVLIGDVRVAEGASVWFGCVLRADMDRIEIGPRRAGPGFADALHQPLVSR